MKHKYLIICIITVIAVVALQSAFLYILYENFRKECENNIEEIIYISIDKEHSSRTHSKIINRVVEELYSKMSQERRDSILSNNPLSPPPPDF